jgi:hypothetical protein
MTKGGSFVLSPECIEGPILSSSKDRRVASLYQDKEDRRKVNTNEGEAYEDSVLEIYGFYSDDAGPLAAATAY